jgi:hypothetical protein
MDDVEFMWRIYKYKEKEWLREAENIRRSRHYRFNRQRLYRAYCYLIGKTGNSLGSWGLSLQRRCRVAFG